jgi:formylglycine-generating enzyme required for sulfatase activity
MSYPQDQFPCSDHHATITGIPPGNNMRVVVTAEDQRGEILLRGEERNITIRVNRDTKGGDIAMLPPPDRFTIDELGMTFVRIPAGEFTMGSPETELGRGDDEIQHKVTLTQSFYMQTTEVTQGQWQEVIEASVDTSLGTNPSLFDNCGTECPVEQVSWDEIQIFIALLEEMQSNAYDCGLPTEAEWEYAARSGSNTAFYGGDITDPEGYDPILNTLAWYVENSDASYSGYYELSSGRCIGPRPVGGRSPNSYGLYDMYGNVSEWCQDVYGEYIFNSTDEAVEDPQGPPGNESSSRVIRGGYFESSPSGCRSAYRSASWSGYPNRSRGFRIVCTRVSR